MSLCIVNKTLYSGHGNGEVFVYDPSVTHTILKTEWYVYSIVEFNGYLYATDNRVLRKVYLCNLGPTIDVTLPVISADLIGNPSVGQFVILNQSSTYKSPYPNDETGIFVDDVENNRDNYDESLTQAWRRMKVAFIDNDHEDNNQITATFNKLHVLTAITAITANAAINIMYCVGENYVFSCSTDDVFSLIHATPISITESKLGLGNLYLGYFIGQISIIDLLSHDTQCITLPENQEVQAIEIIDNNVFTLQSNGNIICMTRDGVVLQKMQVPYMKIDENLFLRMGSHKGALYVANDDNCVFKYEKFQFEKFTSLLPHIQIEVRMLLLATYRCKYFISKDIKWLIIVHLIRAYSF
jgi:hypothetical protein